MGWGGVPRHVRADAVCRLGDLAARQRILHPEIRRVPRVSCSDLNRLHRRLRRRREADKPGRAVAGLRDGRRGGLRRGLSR